MGVILLIIIFMFYFFSTRITKLNILSPTALTCVIFFISTCIATLRAKYWGTYISPLTVLVVWLFLFSIFLGELFGIRNKKRRVEKDIPYHNIESFNISNNKYFFIVIVEILLTYLVYKRFIELAVSAGYSGNVVTHYVRTALQSGARWGAIYSLSILFVTSVGYIFLTLLVEDLFSAKYQKLKVIKIIKNTIPIIPTFIVQLFTTNRSGIIQLFAYAIIIMLLVKRIYYTREKLLSIKTIVVIIVTFTMCLLLFVYYGTYSGKTNTIRNPIETICVYTGGSMVTLTNFLASLDLGSLLFGSYRGVSFSGIIDVLKRFGIHVIVDTGDFGKNIVFSNGYSTNVYSAIGSLVCDFGIIGMMLFEFIFGFTMKKFLNYVIERSKIDIILILFGYFSYDIIGQIFANYALKDFLSVTRTLFIFCVLLAYKFLANKKIQKQCFKDNPVRMMVISSK